MTPLETFLRTEVLLLWLEIARISGVVMVSPLPWERSPRLVKTGIVILLSILVHGQSRPDPAAFQDLTILVPLVFTELFTGLAIGFVVRLIIAIAEITGSVVSPAMGLGAAQLFDPASGEADTTITRLLRMLTMLLAFAIGLHRIIIGSLIMSFQAVPVGSIVHPELAAPFMLDLSASVLATGVRLSLPIVAVLVMLQVALAFISRAAPAMQIFSIGFPLMLLVGGLVLVLGLPDFAREMITEMGRFEAYIDGLLRLLTGR